MASVAWFYQDGGLRTMASVDGIISRKFFANNLKISLAGHIPASVHQKPSLLPRIKCEKTDGPPEFKEISVERYPYSTYMDSTSGQMEPASGARASIPSAEYWPEGTMNRVQAARAPEPTEVSTGKSSFGKNPGSRRKKYKSSAASNSSEMNVVSDNPVEVEDSSEEHKDGSSDYVVYETEPKEEVLSEYELDKKVGRPHPFIDPEKRKTLEPLSSEELWWQWRKPEKEIWSKWQRRRPDVETVFLKAMVETGQVKIYGDHPTVTETALYRARRQVYKEERLQAEQERREKIGPLAYYSEWVKAWTKDTSREAVQKHFEETGEDENTQLLEMFSHQTDREYRIMMGTDNRIRRDPLAMRMREDQIKQIWGGDPVYPTVNYIQDPNEVTDYRGAEFHEPTPSTVAYLKKHGFMISRDELKELLAKENYVGSGAKVVKMDEAMAKAVDIGEKEDDEDSEAENEDKGKVKKIPRNWSALKTNPPEMRKSESQDKPKKDMSLKEAVDDSENLTDFLLDFNGDD